MRASVAPSAMTPPTRRHNLGTRDALFSLRPYTHAVKQRARLTGAERVEVRSGPRNRQKWARVTPSTPPTSPLRTTPCRAMPPPKPLLLNRDGRIRTAGLLLPKQAL